MVRKDTYIITEWTATEYGMLEPTPVIETAGTKYTLGKKMQDLEKENPDTRYLGEHHLSCYDLIKYSME